MSNDNYKSYQKYINGRDILLNAALDNDTKAVEDIILNETITEADVSMVINQIAKLANMNDVLKVLLVNFPNLSPTSDNLHTLCRSECVEILKLLLVPERMKYTHIYEWVLKFSSETKIYEREMLGLLSHLYLILAERPEDHYV
uniref:Uncharacterized protein n=1 Tax=viral metagenome TaxID=1070528 RepID=A0A6C0CIN8_9ZZZZ